MADNETTDSDTDGASVPTLDELTAQRGQEFEAMDSIIRTAEEDGEDGREITVEERAEYAAARSRYDEVVLAIDEVNSANAETVREKRLAREK